MCVLAGLPIVPTVFPRAMPRHLPSFLPSGFVLLVLVAGVGGALFQCLVGLLPAGGLGLGLRQLLLEEGYHLFQLGQAAVLPLAVACAGLVHPFLDAAFGDEAFLHGGNELVEHRDGLMNQGDAEVGDLLVAHVPYGLGIVFHELIAAGVSPHLLVAVMEGAPLLEVAHPQIVLIVVEQLFEAGFGHVGEFDFRLA